MSNFRLILNCILGPGVHSFYKLTGHTISSSTPEILSSSHPYRASSLESLSNQVIRLTRFLGNFGVYMSPILLSYYVYKRNTPGTLANNLDQSAMLKFIATLLSIVFGSYVARGFARFTNPEYLQFLKAVEECHKNPTPSNKRILVHFDCDFSAYPIDFRWSDARDKRPPAPYHKTFPTQSDKVPLILDRLPIKFPLEILLSIIMKTIGRRLIYPGSSGLLQLLMQPAMMEGRSKLVQDYSGVRCRLESFDGNTIDTMFIDKRGSTPNGDYLVIGCEGNGGFYELGTIFPPLESGYSVLGWNHPGFGGSTGVPYPDQDVAAVDTVVKFAMDKLNFTPSQIVLYGWSIGGFTATWAGMRYPNVHGLVIDASFDHILPLARKILPNIMYPFAEMAIRQHFDLDNSRHLKHYTGPILLIRRSQDEVISLDPHNSPPTNRANYLLIDLLKQRFPALINDRAVRLLHEYLGGNARYQEGVLHRYSVNNTACLNLLMEYFHTHPTNYPVNIGPDLDLTTRDQLVLFIASKHLIDYDSEHCAPLPPRYFRRPWNLMSIALNSSSL